MPLLLLSALACNDPDGPLRVEIRGVLVEPDGSETEFFGRGMDGSNDLASTPTVDVADWKAETDHDWEITFAVEHGQWASIGSLSWESDGSITDRGPLGLDFLQDRREAETELYYPLSYALTLDVYDEFGFEGTLAASFDNGAFLEDGEIRAKGLTPPGGDDTTTGTDYGYGTGGGDCYGFYDTTPYFGDIQLDSECWMAGLNQACGFAEEHDAACAALDGLIECCWNYGGSCPYC